MVEHIGAAWTRARRRRKNVLGLIGNKYTVDWTRYHDVDWFEEIRSGVKPALLKDLAAKATAFPRASRCIARCRRSSMTGARWRRAS